MAQVRVRLKNAAMFGAVAATYLAARHTLDFIVHTSFSSMPAFFENRPLWFDAALVAIAALFGAFQNPNGPSNASNSGELTFNDRAYAVFACVFLLGLAIFAFF